MADEPTDERPEFTQEVLDRIVAQGLAEDRAKVERSKLSPRRPRRSKPEAPTDSGAEDTST